MDELVVSLLIPGWLACALAVAAGVIKIVEYRGAYDFTVIVSIVARFSIGLLYLIEPELITPRIILLRFAVTLLFLSENMRQGLRFAGRRYRRT